MELAKTILPILKLLTLSAVFFVWFIRYSNIVEEFNRYGLSPKLRDFVGILKITAVLVIQSNETLQVQIGSALLAFLMLSAFATHLRMKNPPIEFAPSLTLMLFSIIFFITA